jgi:light-regulated signal transduction histidine kinase (bacteriophytochrome)
MSVSPMPAEDELTKVLRENEHLRQSLAESAAALKKAQEEAERNLIAAQSATAELQHFVYAASHDLQEPLRSISTYTQLLHRDYAKDKQAAEFAGFVNDGVTQMNTLIRDLLTYSRTGNPGRRSSINLSAPVQWALFKLAGPIKESGAAITHQDLPDVEVDDTQIAMLFENLLSNAIKFRGEASPVIEISAEENGGGYTVSVRDNGSGIDPRFHDQVFLPFKRLHGKNIPGTGLGLAICRKIVQAHGGRIWVESDGKTGSNVKFTLSA